jgi:transketolase C-terminal domain/subunit
VRIADEDVVGVAQGLHAPGERLFLAEFSPFTSILNKKIAGTAGGAME